MMQCVCARAVGNDCRDVHKDPPLFFLGEPKNLCHCRCMCVSPISYHQSCGWPACVCICVYVGGGHTRTLISQCSDPLSLHTDTGQHKQPVCVSVPHPTPNPWPLGVGRGRLEEGQSAGTPEITPLGKHRHTIPDSLRDTLLLSGFCNVMALWLYTVMFIRLSSIPVV